MMRALSFSDCGDEEKASKCVKVRTSPTLADQARLFALACIRLVGRCVAV